MNLEEKIAYCRGVWQARRSDLFHAALAACESPIERAFVAALLAELWHLERYTDLALQDPTGLTNAVFFASGMERGIATVLFVQATVNLPGRVARFDVALAQREWGRGAENVDPYWDRLVAIELDGHDFHERTKTQARRDKSRDRAAARAGWTVLRFTGSEVYSDPMRCAVEALEVLR